MGLLPFIIGIFFGGILQYAKLNRFNTISGLAILKDFAVPKAIFMAIGVGAILINLEIGLGFADYHTKSFILGGIIFGGLIFGAGMAILGYCPGTLPVSAGEGSLDAIIGIVGGLLGGLAYTLFSPFSSVFSGIDYGKISLRTLAENETLFFILVFAMAILFISVAFWIHKKEGSKDLKWVVAGIALAILSAFTFSTVGSDRPIGASTSYPYAVDALLGVTQSDYFTKIAGSGNWELWLLAGAFVSGLAGSMIRKDFKLTLIHTNWKNYRGSSNLGRVIWALVGGFLLILGARIAGGCTSGHILSGGMQMAVSSLVFAVFVFAGLLATGRVFYKARA